MAMVHIIIIIIIIEMVLLPTHCPSSSSKVKFVAKMDQSYPGQYVVMYSSSFIHYEICT